MKRLREALIAVVVLGTGVALGTAGTHAAFSSKTANDGNRLATGTVTLGHDATQRMFSSTGVKGGTALPARCIVIEYSGTLPATVRIHATANGALKDHVTMKLERGTLARDLGGDCTGFVRDSTDHAGLGAGLLANRTLATFPSGWSAGIVDPATWTSGTARAYRFTPTLADVAAAQGESVAFDVTWEARQS